MVGYKKTKKQLSEKTIAYIENDLLKTNQTHKEIAATYGVFDDVVSDIANSLGLGKDIVPVTSKKPEHHERKGRVSLTEEQKRAVLEDHKRLAPKEICKKYNISDSTYRRILGTKPTSVVKKQVVTANSSNVTVTFNKVSSDELVEVTEELGSDMSVRLFKSYTGSSFYVKPYLFEDKESNYVSALDSFKNRYLKNSKVELLTVYSGSTSLDVQISVALTRFCLENKINLVIKSGDGSINLISEFSQMGRNMSTLSKRTVGLKKYLYKSTKESIQKVATIYYTKSFSEVVITDTFDKALEYIARYEKFCHEQLLKHELVITQINCGNLRQLFKLVKD